jgi:hypothetical protein
LDTHSIGGKTVKRGPIIVCLLADIDFQYFAQLVALRSVARELLCANIGKSVHKVLSLFDVVIGWLDKMVVTKKLGELLEDRMVYLDRRGNCEEFWVGWQPSIMNGLIFKSLALSVSRSLSNSTSKPISADNFSFSLASPSN